MATAQPEGGVATGAWVRRCLYPPFTEAALEYTNSESGDLDHLILADSKKWYNLARRLKVGELEGYRGIVAYYQFGIQLLVEAWPIMDDRWILMDQYKSLQRLSRRLLPPKRQQELSAADEAFLKYCTLERFDDWKGEVMRAFELARMNS